MLAVERPNPASLSPISATARDWPGSVRYGVAIVAPVLALLLTLTVPHVHSDPFFTLFTAAVAISAWLGGTRPGLLAALLSFLAGAYLVPPEGSLAGKSVHDVLQFLLFVTTTLLIIWLIAALQRARARLQRSQEKLQESEARFRSVAESIPQLVWSTAADGSLDYINYRWCEYTGQSFETALDAGWQAVVHADDRARIAGAWEQSLQSGNRFEMEIRVRRSDGAYRWLLARAVPLRDASGQIVKWFGTCTDIQRQKQAEEALRRSEKLAAIARLASSMAHEINNPLTSVTNLLYLLEKSTAGDAASNEYVRAAQAELARIAHISNQTLGLYREPSRPVGLKAAEVIDDLLELYDSKIRERGIVVDKRYGCPGEVRGHRGDLRQLFSNLLLNGFESLDRGGRIKIRIRCTRHSRTGSGTGVRIVIGDTGRGIPPEHRHRLFEPFFTTKIEKGTGLGLWVAQEIVERYGGAMRLRSSVRPGRSGTVVAIFLPAAAAGASHDSSAGVAA
jgi:PAS domain S-box-containing protein